MTGPYGEAAWSYWTAGWRGVLPLPPRRKGPPPSGYTGWVGIEPSGADVQTWCDGPEGAGNIALRLPQGVYGLDVDAYAGKGGAAALKALEATHGPLPATWRVTSRTDGVSGIRLFRAVLEPGRRWRDEPGGHGAGIEAIHWGHRYAVVAPSIHPDTGATYRWWTLEGGTVEGLPVLAELPELPAAWVEALSEVGEVATGEAAGHQQSIDAVNAMPNPAEPCDRMREASARAAARLRDASDGAALHPAARDGTHELVRLGHEGHSGARRALAEHYGAFVAVRVARGGDQRSAEGEWWRLTRGAVGKLHGAQMSGCNCVLPDVGFEWSAPVQGDDADASEGGGEGGEGGLDLASVLGARLLTAAQMRDMPPPAPLITGLLSLDSESWLIARPGSYKTFVALDMAGHVAIGKPWAGRDVAQGEVLYLVAEGIGGMGPRVRAWEARNGPMTGVHFLPLPIQVKREDHWAALVEVTRRHQFVFVILDTQARITVGLNENDNSEMGLLVDAIGKLRRASGACVLTVHHLGRTGQDARGASAIDGAQDSELRLTRTADKRVVLESDKQRHIADDARVELELIEVGTSLVVEAPLFAAATAPDWRANLPLNQSVLVGVMGDIFPGQGATKAELKAEVRKRGRNDPAGAELGAMGDSAFRRAWDALVDSGRFVKIEGVQRYVLGDVDAALSV